MALQQVDRLLIRKQCGKCRRIVRVQHAGQRGVAAAFGQRGQERAGDAGQFALAEQPFAQRQGVVADAHVGIAIQRRRLQYRIDQSLRIARPHAQRITGLIAQAGTVEGQFEMTHILAIGAKGDALVGEHAGGEGLRARIRCHCGNQRTQCGDCREWCGWFQQVAGNARHGLRPRRRNGFDIEVGIRTVGDAFAAECLQTLVDAPADRAELRIAGIAQREHRELELLQRRCAAAVKEFEESACIVRRIAIALGADHHVEQGFVGELAQRIGIGAQQARGEVGGLQLRQQRLGGTFRVAGLAAVDDGRRLRRHDRDRRERLDRQRARHPGEVAGGPEQRGGVGARSERRQQCLLVCRQRGG